MKVSALKYTVLSWVSRLTMLMFLLLPFHAFLTVWAASHFGHYTALRLWKEVLLGICIAGVLYLLATDHKIRSHTLSRRLVWVILIYIALNVVWGLVALSTGDVTEKALGYGLISNLRYLAFFLVTWAVALRLSWLRQHWRWLVYGPAVGVVVFGLLQATVLPADFLRHFGYGPATIPAFETIDENHNYVRIASTLRGANPLGAYLLIPISLFAVLMIRSGRGWRKAAMLAGSAVVLFFSYSRSAWIGAALSVLVVLFLSNLSSSTRKIALGVGGGLVVLGIAIALIFGDSAQFKNLVFHTQDGSASSVTSNEARAAALENGWRDVADEPLGMGPGTAGPASIYNDPKPERIAENYFLQVAQETGVIGLVLFVLINIGVGLLLFFRRADPLALSLFASLIGLTFINLLSHAWTDDTLAYVWWGLAGVAMVPLKEGQDAETAA